jgi:EAL domain-containing protein (putative c-di-GMP-specific phosphodiesterase class I)
MSNAETSVQLLNQLSMIGVVVAIDSLHLKVIAEGVESEEQLTMLKRMGCDQYQGFYRSAAIPAPGIERLLQRAGAAQNDESDIERTQSKLFRLREA